MAKNPDELDETWADLVPEQPKSRERWPVWLAIGAIVLVLICICTTAILVFGRDFIPGLAQPAETISVPTLSGSEETVAPSPANTVEASSPAPQNTQLPTPQVNPTQAATLAPTATLAVPATDPPLTTSNVEAIRLPSPPAIDGLLDEWGELPLYESTFLVFQASTWDGSNDLRAVWRLGWDLNHLYIGVEVADDIHVQTQTGNQLFKGDSLDMQFDTDRNGDLGPNLSPDDYQITFSPGDFTGFPPSAFRFQGTTGGQILDAPGGNQVTVQARQTPTGYALEAAIPWTDLNLSPSEGLVIGLALNANDNDSPGTAVQEVMKSHVVTRTLTDPTSWGTLTLR